MKRVGIRSKIILLTLLILGGGFFVAPEILEEVAEVRYRRTLEDGRANLAERLEKDYKKLNLRNTPRLGDYFVFIYDKQSGKLIREYSFFPPRLIDDYNLAKNQFAINENNFIIINDLVDKFDNLASTNLIGKSPLHLLLNKLKSNNAELDKINLTNLIKKSDLNVQDYNGNSPLILVIRLNLWKKIADLLKVKKLDAFLKNHENKNSISYVIDEDKESFFDLLTIL